MPDYKKLPFPISLAKTILYTVGGILFKKQNIYIETSVISYLVSRPSENLVLAAYQQITRNWWETELKNYSPCISDFVLEEISKGDKTASNARMESVKGFEILPISDFGIELANIYLSKLTIPRNAQLDAFHLAVAIENSMDFIVSWNFKHITNAFIRHKINKINSELGIDTPEICTPEELFKEKI